jgi:hypothetical protein
VVGGEVRLMLEYKRILTLNISLVEVWCSTNPKYPVYIGQVHEYLWIGTHNYQFPVWMFLFYGLSYGCSSYVFAKPTFDMKYAIIHVYLFYANVVNYLSVTNLFYTTHN